MVISIPAPTAALFLLLLLILGTLVVVAVDARRKVADLRLSLDAAREKQQDDERELTQRSAMDSLKDEFVSTVSHELRTPLTSIRGALGLLSSGVFGNQDIKSQNLLRIALTNTERLIRLINDLLDLQRMDSGEVKLQMKRCSLPELVNQVMETMSPLADAGQVNLVIAPAARVLLPNIFFDADPDRMLQVLTNLFSNAIKFAPAFSSVTLEVEAPPDELIFRVVDQGRGIPDDQLESIFERFKQVEHPDAKAIGGTGLGLAICRSIVQQHGGSIWAERNMTRGASFCIRLPRHQRTYDASVASAQSIALATSAGPGNPVPEPRAGSRQESKLDPPILICNDDVAARAFVVMQLRASGHQVLEAGSSSEALEIATTWQAHSPLQAILLDLRMQEMKRWELFKLMAGSVATAHIPLVCLSTGPPIAGGPDSRNRTAQLASDPSSLSDDLLFADLGAVLQSQGEPGRILLVENDLNLANAVLGGFAKTNLLVEHAATLYRAKMLCRERRPDLIILDLTLPNKDGFSLVEWLRSQPLFRSLPLIVYSGRELRERHQAASRMGPTEFFTRAAVHARDVEQVFAAVVPQRRTLSEIAPTQLRIALPTAAGMPLS